MSIHFDRMYERDRQTVIQTDGQTGIGIGRTNA